MGGGNANKTMMSRAKHLEKAKKESGGASQLASNKAAENIKCSICMQTFLCTIQKPALISHQEGKHSNKTFSDCFPNFVEDVAKNAVKAANNKAKSKK